MLIRRLRFCTATTALEVYELSGTDANHFTVGADGAISVGATDLSPGEYSFALELVSADKSTRARRGLSLRVTDALVIVEPAQPVQVAAAATLNAEVLTVLLGGGENSSFLDATDDNFKTGGGGNQVTVSLARAATAAFNADNAMLDFVLTANADGETATATIRFASAPRAIDNSELFAISLYSVEATAGVEILAGGESGLSIWHFDGTETYELDGVNSVAFDVSSDTGEIRIASGGLDSTDSPYNLTLRLSGGGVVATREIRVDVGDYWPVDYRSGFGSSGGSTSGGGGDNQHEGFDGVVERGNEFVVCERDERQFQNRRRRASGGVVGAGGDGGV